MVVGFIGAGDTARDEKNGGSAEFFGVDDSLLESLLANGADGGIWGREALFPMDHIDDAMDGHPGGADHFHVGYLIFDPRAGAFDAIEAEVFEGIELFGVEIPPGFDRFVDEAFVRAGPLGRGF